MGASTTGESTTNDTSSNAGTTALEISESNSTEINTATTTSKSAEDKSSSLTNEEKEKNETNEIKTLTSFATLEKKDVNSDGSPSPKTSLTARTNPKRSREEEESNINEEDQLSKKLKLEVGGDEAESDVFDDPAE